MGVWGASQVARCQPSGVRRQESNGRSEAVGVSGGSGGRQVRGSLDADERAMLQY